MKMRSRGGLATRRSKKAGMPPGTLVHIGSAPEQTRIVVIDYDEAGLRTLSRHVTGLLERGLRA